MLFPELSGIIKVDNYGIGMNDYTKFINDVFGKWTVRGVLKKGCRTHFLVQCKCGTFSTPSTYHVIHGLSSSCKYCAPKKHGYGRTPTNRSWNGAKNRCNNKNNKDYMSYGGRGIKFCERWNKFEAFLSDMGEKPVGLSLDRINNDGNYEPDNCRWATKSEQNSNQRKRYSVVKIKKGN